MKLHLVFLLALAASVLGLQIPMRHKDITDFAYPVPPSNFLRKLIVPNKYEDKIKRRTKRSFIGANNCPQNWIRVTKPRNECITRQVYQERYGDDYDDANVITES